MSIGENEEKQLAQPERAPATVPAPVVVAGPVPPQHSRVHVQTAQAAESAVVIQVGGDLYLSDAALSGLWTPAEGAADECPYPGLDAFGPGRAKWFFGRETVTGELLRHLDAMTRGGPGGPLLVVAPSGTGKSSLLGAGLLNALAEGRLGVSGATEWPRLMITPGAYPVQTLRSALGTLASVQTTAGDSRFVVVIDQLEEIFTVCESEAERSAFFDEISTMAADAGPGSALVVLGMRSDFYTRATAYPVLRRVMQSRQVVLGAMSAAEVRQAIVRPARAAGLTLEDGLTERLLHDLGVDEGDVNGLPAEKGGRTVDDGLSAGGGYEPGRLPLLAHALRATWQHRDGSRLTLAGYEATGGIAGAIARTAEDVYAQLDEPGQLAARQLFLGLVRVGGATGGGDTTADTRRRLAADGLLSQAGDPVAARAALEAFTAARLLTSGGQAVEITHEALLRRWPRLRGWIEEDRAGLLVRQELEDAAATWTREGRDAAGLYGGIRLASAQAWADAPGHLRELTQAGKEFLAASMRRRRRSARTRNGVIAVLAALSLVLAGLSVFALNQRSAAEATSRAAQAASRAAEAASRTAQAGLLAAEAGQAWADFRPDTGLKFAVAADRLNPSSPQVRSTLLTTQAVPITGRLLTNGAPEGSIMEAAAFNRAGTVIAGVTEDDKVELWSAATYRLLWSFQFPKIGGKRGPANGVAFSPDGKTMVVAQHGGPWLFDVSNPAHPVHTGNLPVPAVPGDKAPQVTAIAVSPDGTMIAGSVFNSANTATVNSPNAAYVLLWDLATRAAAGVIAEGSLANSLVFTPDGRSLVAARYDGGVDLWDVRRHTRTAVIQAGNPDNSVAGAAVTPDGQTIAFNATTGPLKYAIKLWSIASRRVTGTVPVNGATSLSSLAISPDGAHLAAGSQDGTVRLWDGGVLVGNFSGHRDLVGHVAFSPDGATLASASDDGTIDLWNTRGPIVDGNFNSSNSLAFSPDGKTLAISTVAGAIFVVALYSMPAGKLTGVLPVGGSSPVVAFSPDGKTLAVAPNTPGEPLELWNVATRRMTGQATTGLTSMFNTTIGFSPDGTLLAISAHDDTSVQVWSTARLARVAAFGADQQTDLPPQQARGGAAAVAFSPDGRLLTVAGSDGMIRVYGVPGFSLLDVVKPPDEATTALAFSPDGRDLALASFDGNVYLYAVPATYTSLKGKIVSRGTFSASAKYIRTVEFLSDNSLVAAGGDAAVRFWNVPAGNNFTATIPVQTISTHGGQIDSISYSASLGLLATGSASGSRVWDTNPARVAANICQTLKAPVQPALWKEYLPEIPYTPVCG